jgi:hypothetical protein
MLMSLAPTADTSRLDWIITLVIFLAIFVAWAILVVRGNRNPEKVRTRTQTLRLTRARRSLWLLAAWICIIIARIILAH